MVSRQKFVLVLIILSREEVSKFTKFQRFHNFWDVYIDLNLFSVIMNLEGSSKTVYLGFETFACVGKQPNAEPARGFMRQPLAD